MNSKLFVFGSRSVALLIATCSTLGIIFSASPARAWGSRGHATVCEAAIFLVQNEELANLLRSRISMMTHLCNAPDTYWKGLGGEAAALGGPTHYIDPEIIGLAIREFPLDFAKLQEQYEGKADQTRPDRKIFSLAKEMGSLWWRADQFFRAGLLAARQAAEATPPANSKEQQQNDLPFNKGVYDMIVAMGLMGHFVGDGGQPFHSTADFDGYAQGHGGIHSFYEEEMVSGQDEKLTADVVAKAKNLFGELLVPKKRKKVVIKNTKENRFKAKMAETQILLADTTLEKMRALSAITADDIGAVLQKDPVSEKSVVKLENGMELKSIAKRSVKSDTLKNFRPLIVQQMARSAALLAQLWDDIYDKAGEPKLKAYRSYAFPFEPPFVAPDYVFVPKK